MNFNSSNRFSIGSRQDFQWEDMPQHSTILHNRRTAFGVRRDEMDAPLIPEASPHPTRSRGAGAASLDTQAAMWEHKIGIGPANGSAARNDFEEPFLETLGKHGWIFVSENQGIFHFKRPKRHVAWGHVESQPCTQK